MTAEKSVLDKAADLLMDVSYAIRNNPSAMPGVIALEKIAVELRAANAKIEALDTVIVDIASELGTSRIYSLSTAIAKLKEERDQFAEQAAARDQRDADMQEIMRINNELRAALERLGSMEAMASGAGGVIDSADAASELVARIKYAREAIK